MNQSDEPTIFSNPLPDSKPYDDGPGSIENLHNKAHDVFPVPFSGIKLLINKGLSSHFQVSHSLNLCNDENSGYRFCATYAGHNKFSESESYPVIMGEIQPNGQLQAQMVTQVSSICRLRYLSQIQNCKMAGQQLATEFRGRKWQAGITFINPDLNRGQVMAAIDTVRQLSKRIYLGSMFFYHASSQVPGGQDGVWSFGGKYVADFWQFAASLRPWQLALHSSFHMRIRENLQLAAELESTVAQQTSTASLGYQYDIPKSNLSFKAQIDSNWNISAILEKKLIPFPFTFTICSIGNHLSSKYEVGVGLTVG